MSLPLPFTHLLRPMNRSNDSANPSARDNESFSSGPRDGNPEAPGRKPFVPPAVRREAALTDLTASTHEMGMS